MRAPPPGRGRASPQAPWHFLYFLPEPHQQGSLRPIFSRSLLIRVPAGAEAAGAAAPPAPGAPGGGAGPPAGGPLRRDPGARRLTQRRRLLGTAAGVLHVSGPLRRLEHLLGLLGLDVHLDV